MRHQNSFKLENVVKAYIEEVYGPSKSSRFEEVYLRASTMFQAMLDNDSSDKSFQQALNSVLNKKKNIEDQFNSCFVKIALNLLGAESLFQFLGPVESADFKNNLKKFHSLIYLTSAAQLIAKLVFKKKNIKKVENTLDLFLEIIQTVVVYDDNVNKVIDIQAAVRSKSKGGSNGRSDKERLNGFVQSIVDAIDNNQLNKHLLSEKLNEWSEELSSDDEAASNAAAEYNSSVASEYKKALLENGQPEKNKWLYDSDINEIVKYILNLTANYQVPNTSGQSIYVAEAIERNGENQENEGHDYDSLLSGRLEQIIKSRKNNKYSFDLILPVNVNKNHWVLHRYNNITTIKSIQRIKPIEIDPLNHGQNDDWSCGYRVIGLIIQQISSQLNINQLDVESADDRIKALKAVQKAYQIAHKNSDEPIILRDILVETLLKINEVNKTPDWSKFNIDEVYKQKTADLRKKTNTELGKKPEDLLEDFSDSYNTNVSKQMRGQGFYVSSKAKEENNNHHSNPKAAAAEEFNQLFPLSHGINIEEPTFTDESQKDLIKGSDFRFVEFTKGLPFNRKMLTGLKEKISYGSEYDDKEDLSNLIEKCNSLSNIDQILKFDGNYVNLKLSLADKIDKPFNFLRLQQILDKSKQENKVGKFTIRNRKALEQKRKLADEIDNELNCVNNSATTYQNFLEFLLQKLIDDQANMSPELTQEIFRAVKSLLINGGCSQSQLDYWERNGIDKNALEHLQKLMLPLLDITKQELEDTIQAKSQKPKNAQNILFELHKNEDAKRDNENAANTIKKYQLEINALICSLQAIKADPDSEVNSRYKSLNSVKDLIRLEQQLSRLEKTFVGNWCDFRSCVEAKQNEPAINLKELSEKWFDTHKKIQGARENVNLILKTYQEKPVRPNFNELFFDYVKNVNDLSKNRQIQLNIEGVETRNIKLHRDFVRRKCQGVMKRKRSSLLNIIKNGGRVSDDKKIAFDIIGILSDYQVKANTRFFAPNASRETQVNKLINKCKAAINAKDDIAHLQLQSDLAKVARAIKDERSSIAKRFKKKPNSELYSAIQTAQKKLQQYNSELIKIAFKEPTSSEKALRVLATVKNKEDMNFRFGRFLGEMSRVVYDEFVKHELHHARDNNSLENLEKIASIIKSYAAEFSNFDALEERLQGIRYFIDALSENNGENVENLDFKNKLSCFKDKKDYDLLLSYIKNQIENNKTTIFALKQSGFLSKYQTWLETANAFDAIADLKKYIQDALIQYGHNKSVGLQQEIEDIILGNDNTDALKAKVEQTINAIKEKISEFKDILSEESIRQIQVAALIKIDEVVDTKLQDYMLKDTFSDEHCWQVLKGNGIFEINAKHYPTEKIFGNNNALLSSQLTDKLRKILSNHPFDNYIDDLNQINQNYINNDQDLDTEIKRNVKLYVYSLLKNNDRAALDKIINEKNGVVITIKGKKYGIQKPLIEYVSENAHRIEGSSLTAKTIVIDLLQKLDNKKLLSSSWGNGLLFPKNQNKNNEEVESLPKQFLRNMFRQLLENGEVKPIINWVNSKNFDEEQYGLLLPTLNNYCSKIEVFDLLKEYQQNKWRVSNGKKGIKDAIAYKSIITILSAINDRKGRHGDSYLSELKIYRPWEIEKKDVQQLVDNYVNLLIKLKQHDELLPYLVRPQKPILKFDGELYFSPEELITKIDNLDINNDSEVLTKIIPQLSEQLINKYFEFGEFEKAVASEDKEKLQEIFDVYKKIIRYGDEQTAWDLHKGLIKALESALNTQSSEKLAIVAEYYNNLIHESVLEPSVFFEKLLTENQNQSEEKSKKFFIKSISEKGYHFAAAALANVWCGQQKRTLYHNALKSNQSINILTKILNDDTLWENAASDQLRNILADEISLIKFNEDGKPTEESLEKLIKEIKTKAYKQDFDVFVETIGKRLDKEAKKLSELEVLKIALRKNSIDADNDKVMKETSKVGIDFLRKTKNVLLKENFNVNLQFKHSFELDSSGRILNSHNVKQIYNELMAKLDQLIKNFEINQYVPSDELIIEVDPEHIESFLIYLDPKYKTEIIKKIDQLQSKIISYMPLPIEEVLNTTKEILSYPSYCSALIDGEPFFDKIATLSDLKNISTLQRLATRFYKHQETDLLEYYSKIYETIGELDLDSSDPLSMIKNRSLRKELQKCDLSNEHVSNEIITKLNLAAIQGDKQFLEVDYLVDIISKDNPQLQDQQQKDQIKVKLNKVLSSINREQNRLYTIYNETLQRQKDTEKQLQELNEALQSEQEVTNKFALIDKFNVINAYYKFLNDLISAFQSGDFANLSHYDLIRSVDIDKCENLKPYLESISNFILEKQDDEFSLPLVHAFGNEAQKQKATERQEAIRYKNKLLSFLTDRNSIVYDQLRWEFNEAYFSNLFNQVIARIDNLDKKQLSHLQESLANLFQQPAEKSESSVTIFGEIDVLKSAFENKNPYQGKYIFAHLLPHLQKILQSLQDKNMLSERLSAIYRQIEINYLPRAKATLSQALNSDSRYFRGVITKGEIDFHADDYSTPEQRNSITQLLVSQYQLVRAFGTEDEIKAFNEQFGLLKSYYLHHTLYPKENDNRPFRYNTFEEMARHIPDFREYASLQFYPRESKSHENNQSLFSFHDLRKDQKSEHKIKCLQAYALMPLNERLKSYKQGWISEKIIQLNQKITNLKFDLVVANGEEFASTVDYRSQNTKKLEQNIDKRTVIERVNQNDFDQYVENGICSENLNLLFNIQNDDDDNNYHELAQMISDLNELRETILYSKKIQRAVKNTLQKNNTKNNKFSQQGGTNASPNTKRLLHEKVLFIEELINEKLFLDARIEIEAWLQCYGNNNFQGDILGIFSAIKTAAEHLLSQGKASEIKNFRESKLAELVPSLNHKSNMTLDIAKIQNFDKHLVNINAAIPIADQLKSIIESLINGEVEAVSGFQIEVPLNSDNSKQMSLCVSDKYKKPFKRLFRETPEWAENIVLIIKDIVNSANIYGEKKQDSKTLEENINELNKLLPDVNERKQLHEIYVKKRERLHEIVQSADQLAIHLVPNKDQQSTLNKFQKTKAFKESAQKFHILVNVTDSYYDSIDDKSQISKVWFENHVTNDYVKDLCFDLLNDISNYAQSSFKGLLKSHDQYSANSLNIKARMAEDEDKKADMLVGEEASSEQNIDIQVANVINSIQKDHPYAVSYDVWEGICDNQNDKESGENLINAAKTKFGKDESLFKKFKQTLVIYARVSRILEQLSSNVSQLNYNDLLLLVLELKLIVQVNLDHITEKDGLSNFFKPSKFEALLSRFNNLIDVTILPLMGRIRKFGSYKAEEIDKTKIDGEFPIILDFERQRLESSIIYRLETKDAWDDMLLRLDKRIVLGYSPSQHFQKYTDTVLEQFAKDFVKHEIFSSKLDSLIKHLLDNYVSSHEIAIKLVENLLRHYQDNANSEDQRKVNRNKMAKYVISLAKNAGPEFFSPFIMQFFELQILTSDKHLKELISGLREKHKAPDFFQKYFTYYLGVKDSKNERSLFVINGLNTELAKLDKVNLEDDEKAAIVQILEPLLPKDVNNRHDDSDPFVRLNKKLESYKPALNLESEPGKPYDAGMFGNKKESFGKEVSEKDNPNNEENFIPETIAVGSGI